MKTKNNIVMLVALFAAMITFACGGGAAATSVPEQATQEVQQEPTKEITKLEGELEILSSHSYVDGFNDYNVVGEIQNNTNQTLENITLSVSITDESGVSLLKDDSDNPVESVEVQPYIDVLVAGAVAPFNYYISADEAQPANFEVSIKSYDESSAQDLADVTIENVNLGENENGDILIAGEVVNKSSEYVDVEAMAGAVLDDGMNVLAAGSPLTSTRYLYPAGDPVGRDRGPFIVQLYGPIENLSHWKVYARGVETSNVPSVNLEIALSTSYKDAYGDYHLLGTVKNNGTSQISPSILGGLHTPDGFVFDAASVNIPLYLNPGGSAPFDMYTFQLMSVLPEEQAATAESVVQTDYFWTFPTEYDLVALEAENVKVTNDGYSWTVTGSVVNTSEKALASVNTVVQFLDADGQVIATNSVPVYPPEGSETIDPGTSNEFSLTIYAPEDWDPSSLEYQVILQGVASE